MTEEDNVRFDPIDGDAMFETMAPETVLYWDPITGYSTAYFRTQKYLKVDGVIREDVPGIPVGGLTLDITNNLHKLYGVGLTDPITGAPLDGVSVAGLMTLVKTAFDSHINDHQHGFAADDIQQPEDQE